MQQHEAGRIDGFFAQLDEAGTSNRTKVVPAEGREAGIITDGDGRLIGFGIHIKNEDVYPIQDFELFLRDKDLVGTLDLSGCADVVFIDVYRNRIGAVDVTGMESLRILGLQDNRIEALDPSSCRACQGIDIGKNRLRALDVSHNAELVELYVHHNQISALDLSSNPKLKYFWCNGNLIETLDTTGNPLLRHLDCTDNPLVHLRACAPAGEAAGQARPAAAKGAVELDAGEGGFIGAKFCPVYDERWKETGQWQQAYYAYPEEGFAFEGWMDAGGACVSTQAEWIVDYGSCAKLAARFMRV